MKPPPYKWKAPRYHVHQRVRVVDYWGRIVTGTIWDVETSYWSKGEAHHCYTIKPDNWAHRKLYISEDKNSILEVIGWAGELGKARQTEQEAK